MSSGPWRPFLLLAIFTLLISAGIATPRGQDKTDQVVFVGAGDIANCELPDGGAGAVATGRLIDSIPGTVFTAGDHAYPTGTADQFRDCYEPRWGKVKSRTRPSPGNHDLLTSNGKPYFDYFGEAAGPDRRGFYSYELGKWHIVSLNSAIPADNKSKQLEWLRKDLIEHHTTCTLAYWHIPVFSSGPHGADLITSGHMLDVWKLLYQFGADIVVNGHDHDYERFAPQNPGGKPDPKGIREFVVGTGGGGLYQFKSIRPNSEVHDNKSYGVLKLVLGESDYSWEFIPAVGQFHDSGTGTCVP
jgi:calcineurin-like phosphoesterase family protein